MHDVLITTEMHPLSVSRTMKDGHASLRITVKNMSDSGKYLAYSVETGHGLSFSKGGLQRQVGKELGFIEPRQESTVILDLFPTYNAREGFEPVDITVFSFRTDRFKHVIDKFMRKMQVRLN